MCNQGCYEGTPVSGYKKDCNNIRKFFLEIFDLEKSYYAKNKQLASLEKIKKNNISQLKGYNIIIHDQTDYVLYLEAIPTSESYKKIIMLIYIYNPNMQKIGTVQKVFGIVPFDVEGLKNIPKGQQKKIIQTPTTFRSNCS